MIRSCVLGAIKVVRPAVTDRGCEFTPRPINSVTQGCRVPAASVQGPTRRILRADMQRGRVAGPVRVAATKISLDVGME